MVFCLSTNVRFIGFSTTSNRVLHFAFRIYIHIRLFSFRSSSGFLTEICRICLLGLSILAHRDKHRISFLQRLYQCQISILSISFIINIYQVSVTFPLISASQYLHQFSFLSIKGLPNSCMWRDLVSLPLRLMVEFITVAMTTEVAHDTKALGVDYGFNGSTNVCRLS